jgi:hypothetical protein
VTIVFFGFVFERELPSWFGALCCLCVAGGVVLLTVDADSAFYSATTPALLINLASVLASGLQVALMRRAWRRIAEQMLADKLRASASTSAVEAAIAPHRSSSALALVNGTDELDSRALRRHDRDDGRGGGDGDGDTYALLATHRSASSLTGTSSAEALALAPAAHVMRTQMRWRAPLLMPVATLKLFIATLLVGAAAAVFERDSLDALRDARWSTLLFLLAGVRCVHHCLSLSRRRRCVA